MKMADEEAADMEVADMETADKEAADVEAAGMEAADGWVDIHQSPTCALPDSQLADLIVV